MSLGRCECDNQRNETISIGSVRVGLQAGMWEERRMDLRGDEISNLRHENALCWPRRTCEENMLNALLLLLLNAPLISCAIIN